LGISRFWEAPSLEADDRNMTTSGVEGTFDFEWFRSHLIEEILPNWLKSVVTEEGLFLPHLDRGWNRLGKDYGTLVSQSRLLYNFAQGYELTTEDGYLRAVESGARFLLANFRDEKYGGWYWSCRKDGEVLDSHKNSYGHAFVIFGLTHAFRVTGDEALKEAAVETWRLLNSRFRDEHGGLWLRMNREFKEMGETKSQNPLMHTFEALLALSEVEGLSRIREDAEAVADFVINRLRRSDGILPELFTRDWRELPAEGGGRIDIGHAFEWAYLLSMAVEMGMRPDYLTHASRFLDYGLRIGYDPKDGGIYSPATPEGKIEKKRKGWWEQCEATRALMHFAVVRGRSDLWEPLEKTVGFIRRFYIDPEFGGWYRSIGDGDEERDENKGDEWKVDYHVVGMCMEAIRLSSR